MDKGTLILLVDEGTTGIDSIRCVLADRAHHFRVQRVADVATALARILGGGVDIVLLNLPAAAGLESERLLPFLQLRNQAQTVPIAVPIVVLCGAADESLAEAAIREGAADYLIREAYAVDLLRVLRSVSAKTGAAAIPRRSAASTGRSGRVLAASDYDRARRLGHQMKGNGSPYGFPKVTLLGSAIEQAAAGGSAIELASQIQLLEGYLNLVEIA
jgi:FixJ family two-component response regulator